LQKQVICPVTVRQPTSPPSSKRIIVQRPTTAHPSPGGYDFHRSMFVVCLTMVFPGVIRIGVNRQPKGGAMKAIHRLIEEQVGRWEILRREKPEARRMPVITISREPGSGGKLVARAVADRLGLDLFDQEVINAMAKDADTSTRVIRTLDEKSVSMIDDWVTAAISQRHLWPDELSRVLMRVIGTIGRHGKAVIVGRGANFVLPPEARFRVRIIAPQDQRISRVAETYGLSQEEAKTRVLRTESDRRAFVRKYFHSDIRDPLNYDMILNSGTLSIESCADAICNVLA
jgi:cytidylate kinase